eukprot:7166701-Pyramimonas_sp.AAC.1
MLSARSLGPIRLSNPSKTIVSTQRVQKRCRVPKWRAVRCAASADNLDVDVAVIGGGILRLCAYVYVLPNKYVYSRTCAYAHPATR